MPSSIAFRISSLRASVARRRWNRVRPSNLVRLLTAFPLTWVELADNDEPRAKNEKVVVHGASDGFLRPIDRNPKDC